MRIRPATPDDVDDLARLVCLDTLPDEPDEHTVGEFAAELGRWWSDRGDSHCAFVAHSPEGEVIGMAWVAFVPRVPRPGASVRTSADVQTVFVRPEHRGRGIGAALVEAASEHVLRQGALHVTVHSSERAVPVYERVGFVPSRRLLQKPDPRDVAPQASRRDV